MIQYAKSSHDMVLALGTSELSATAQYCFEHGLAHCNELEYPSVTGQDYVSYDRCWYFLQLWHEDECLTAEESIDKWLVQFKYMTRDEFKLKHPILQREINNEK